jgi:hypothetical protein
MPDNGSGTYSRTNGTNSGSDTWANDRDAGTKITASNHDTHDEDIATALTARLCKNGETTPSANLPMGGFAHTNVAVASARTMYGRASQVQDSALVWGGTSTGAANVYAISLSPAITAYTAGLRVAFLSHQASTSTTTLNINSVGATAMKVLGNDTGSGSIANAQIVEVIYDGTDFEIVGRVSALSSITTDRLLGRDTAGTGGPEQLTVGGGVEFTGSGGIQRSALTGDVTASAGSGTTTIANDVVTAAKTLFNNNTALRIKDSGGTAIDVVQVTNNDNTIINAKTGKILYLAIDESPLLQMDADELKAASDDAMALGSASIKYSSVFTHLLNLGIDAAVTAAGSTTADATVLSTTINMVTTVASGTGVRLPSATAGDIVIIKNKGANTLSIYPPTGGTVDTLGANVAASLVTLTSLIFIYRTATAVERVGMWN